MTRIEGQIKAIRQCGGCVEVTVSGPRSGTFTMDNCCAENIIANEGPTLVGQWVEYRDGHVRFHRPDTSPSDKSAGQTLLRHERLQRSIVAPLRRLRNWRAVKVFANGKIRIKFKDRTVKTIPAPQACR